MEAFFRQNACRQPVADLQETSSIQQLEKVFDQPNERQEITSDIMHKLNTIQVGKFEYLSITFRVFLMHGTNVFSK